MDDSFSASVSTEFPGPEPTIKIPKPRSSNPAYRTDLDGLRGLAVMMALFFHSTGLSGGYVGADIFFVISGFLITGIVERDIAQKKFDACDFYTRRVRRLFPAFFVFVVATVVASTFILMPHDLEDFGRSLASTVVFVSNFEFWRESGYFDLQSSWKPLLHTWSLAVEEQFYIAFPLFLILCRKMSKRGPVLPLVAAFIGFLALSQWLALHSPSAAYYLAFSRAWELLLGGLLSVWKPRARVPLLSVGGLVLIAVAAVTYTPRTPFPGLAALVPDLGAVAVILAGGRGAGGAFLRAGPLVYVGRISYPLYLWHWPILALGHYYLGDMDWRLIVASLFAATILAAATYHFVEGPIRKRRFLRSDGALLRVALVGAVILAAAAAGLVLSHGAPWRLPARAARFDTAIDDRENMSCLDRDLAKLGAKSLCVIGAPTTPSVIVWADSQGWALQSAISRALAAKGLAAYLATRSGCPPAMGLERLDYQHQCQQFAAAVMSLARAVHPKLVIIVGSWGTYQASDMRAGRLAGWVAADASLRSTISTLRQYRSSVLLFDPLPAARKPVPRALAQQVAYGHSMDIESSKSVFLNQPYFNTVKTLPVSRVGLWRGLCGDICQVTVNGTVLYIDMVHASRSISGFAQPYISAGLNDALAPRKSDSGQAPFSPGKSTPFG